MGLQLIPPDINIDFVGKRYIFVALSTVINVVAIILLLVVGLNYGVDFAGGLREDVPATETPGL